MKKEAQVREPIATWWKIDGYRELIEPLKVVAFTGSFVTYIVKSWSLGPIKPRELREKRDNIFPTFAEAKQEAIARAERNISTVRESLEAELSQLAKLESLKEPQ